MVDGVPTSRVSHEYRDYTSFSGEPEYVASVILECPKGKPFVPETVYSDTELRAKFKTSLPQFFGCGGGELKVIRATVGTPVKAKTLLYDTAASPANVMNIENKVEGDYKVYYTATNNGVTSVLTIEEDGYQSEKYTGETIKEIVDKINASSEIITAEFVDEGTGLLGLAVKTIVGSNPGDTPGSNGTVKPGTTDGTLPDDEAPAAHEKALKVLEGVVDPEPGLLFCTKDLITVHAKYATHTVEMNKDINSKFKILIVGGKSDASINERIAAARSFGEEEIWYVGHSLIGKDGVTYKSNDMAAAVAGTLARIPYDECAWGGQPEKVLGNGMDAFFDDFDEILEREDIERMNEAGVITFTKDKHGLKILETVTTATPAKSSTDEDEGGVVRIVQKAKREALYAGDALKGLKMTPTFVDDMKKKVEEALEPLKKDEAIVDDVDNNIKAYEVFINAIPRAKQKLGRADIELVLNVAHAARKIFTKVVVR